MAIFKFNYDKEGKGIDKNAPEKNIFYTYFESFIRNFWNLIKVNFIYVAASIPMLLILGAIFAGFVYPNISGQVTEYIAKSGIAEPTQAEATYIGVFMSLFVTELLLIIGSGPASAYFAYAAKCMATEEHVWIWSDFKNKFKENFKQSMIVSIIDIVVVTLLIFSTFFYTSAYAGTGNILFFVMRTLLFVVAILYCFMHGYIYQFMVTFENKLSVIYKNAFIMAVAKLPQNLFCTAVSVLFTYFVFTVLNPVFSIILLFVIWYALMRYPMEFCAARSIKKLIIDKQPEKGLED